MSTERTATLTVDGKSVEFPVMTGTHGNDVIDIRTLGGKTGLFTAEQRIGSVAIRTDRTLSDTLGPWPEWLASGALLVLLGYAVAVGRGVRVGRTEPARPRRTVVD